MDEFSGDGYRVWTPHNFGTHSGDEGDIDIHVNLKDGKHYYGTLYTIEHLRQALDDGRRFGEYANGAYAWDPSMIVVRDLLLATVRATIEDLIQTGDIEKALERGSIEAQ